MHKRAEFGDLLSIETVLSLQSKFSKFYFVYQHIQAVVKRFT